MFLILVKIQQRANVAEEAGVLPRQDIHNGRLGFIG